MNKGQVLSGVARVSVLLATGALAEILGVQPGTSDNPKDNVLKEIPRSTPGEGTVGPGGSGPGTRTDELVDMKKEKPELVTQQELEHNAEKTHGGGANKLVLANRKARMGRNPQTGAEIKISAKRVVKFRLAKDAILGKK
jgi:hypothetical protein